MNIEETVEWLGQVNSGSCYPKTYDEIDSTLPYFNLVKNQDGHYVASVFNYITHDNAPRMPFVVNYFLDNVFPYVKGDLSGYYNIQLHDTYTYLNDGKSYKDVLTFGKFKDEKGPVVIPDCYFLSDWGGKYNGVVDKYAWEDKWNKIVFAGSTTGNRNAKLNERIETCLWAIDKPDCDFYITNIVQMDAKAALEAVPNLRNVLRPPMSFDDQMKYKYMLLIDGNTNKWTCDSFFTNSLSFMMPSKDMLWYYPLMQDGTHYVGVRKDDMLDKFKYYNYNSAEAKHIVLNGNILAKHLFNQKMCRKYLVSLFEAIAANK